ncbi:hypothetical protein B0H21DRAFT_30432 [Amylocystis lapponica]|nr:hypothetical protein B0H21DRAFT_30432 [Amylocystis lapponica]
MHTPNTPLNEADLSVNGLLTRASNIRPEQSTSDSQKGRQDDDIAVALSGHGNIPLRRTVSVGHSSGDRARLSRASCHTTVSNSRWSMVQQRLGTAKGRRLSSLSPALPTGHDCILCKYPIHGQEVKAPCGDYYDTLCVLKLFEAAARDESLFPPTCCRQRIPLHDVQPYMDATLLAQHKEKSKEYKTVKRIYCANPTCSRFLGPQSEGLLSWIRPSRRCPTSGCSTTTCMRCRARVQPHGHHCVDDEQEREVLALAKEAGWTRCPRCNQMIELDGGCFHMTCRCKAEFCYLCRSTWKTCSCCQWDDQRAAVAAGMWEDRIARTLPAPPAATAHFPTHKSKLGKSSRNHSRAPRAALSLRFRMLVSRLQIPVV